jgi:archaellum component FlaF (FlaF/FlaG flagellin family)
MDAFGRYGAQYTQGTNAANNGAYTVEGWALDSSRTNVTFYRNGSVSGVKSLSSVADLTSGFYLGEASAGNCTWQGDIAEVLIYDHQLSKAEMAQLSYYLSAKYGYPLLAPTITPNGGTNSTSITISMAPTGGSYHVRYTTDGTIPTGSSSLYSAPVILTQSSFVQAALFDDNGVQASPITSAQFYVGDSQNIGISDSWQYQYFGRLISNPYSFGINGLSYLQDYQLGLNPLLFCNNGDGLSDAQTLQLGYNPTNTLIAGNGLTNAQNLALGLNPFNPGVLQQAPSPNPSDQSRPVIHLNNPSGASLVVP